MNALYPCPCIFCGLPSGRHLPLCTACEAEIPANSHSCTRCALPLPPRQASTDEVCGQCLIQPPPFARVIAPWIYSARLAFIVQRWKYQRNWYLTALLAQLWRAGAQGHSRVDLVVPVPLHWTKFWRRGANQANLLAHEILQQQPASTARIAPGLVRRHRATAAQSHMNASARANNLQGAFTARQPCDNLRLAVVDDVFTTGATTTALCQALLAAGAHHVEVWCLARTPAPHS